MFRFLDCGRKLEDLEETQHIKGPEPESDLDHPGTDPPISFSSNVHVWNSSWETSGNIYCLNFKFKVPLEPRTQTLFTLSLIITSFSSHRCCRLAKIIVCFGRLKETRSQTWMRGQEVDWEGGWWKHSDGILCVQQIPEIFGTFGTTYIAAESWKSSAIVCL